MVQIYEYRVYSFKRCLLCHFSKSHQVRTFITEIKSFVQGGMRILSRQDYRETIFDNTSSDPGQVIVLKLYCQMKFHLVCCSSTTCEIKNFTFWDKQD